MGIGDHQLNASEAALFETTEELSSEGLAFAVARLQAQQLPSAIGVDAHGHDQSPRADLEGLAAPAVLERRIQVELCLTAAVQRPLQERSDLTVEPLADEAHLRAGDDSLRANGGHQGVHLAGGDALDPGLHDHGVERLIDLPPGLENRWKKAPGAEFRDRQRDVPYLSGEQAGASAVAVAQALVGALMALRAEHGSNLQFDQLLQAMAHELGDQLPGRAAIE